LGEAIPHLEAWLIDDAAAVRDALQLSSDATIPNVAKAKDPKLALNGLIDASPSSRDLLSVLREIAYRVQGGRCAHAKETGFAAFIDDVQSEFRSE
jgi:hypothetical protein